MNASGKIFEAERAMSELARPSSGGKGGFSTANDSPDPAPPEQNAVTAEPDAPALSEEHYREIGQAKQRRKAIDRAVGVASFSGWTIAIFAGLGLPFALLSLPSFLLCAGMIAVAAIEFRGRRRLKALDPGAPRLLGTNQIAFCAVLCSYCLFRICESFFGPGPYAEAVAAQPELAGSLGSIEKLYRTCSLAVYGAVIALSLVFQGGTAFFYFSREKHLRAYRKETPDWILSMEDERGANPRPSPARTDCRQSP